MQGIFQKENTDKALKYGIYRHLPTYEKIIRNLVSFFDKEALFNSIFNANPLKTIPIIYQYINNYKMFHDVSIVTVPLNQLVDWHINEFGITCKKSSSFMVRYYDIQIEGREVRHWNQPLLKAIGQAIFGLIICERDNKIEFLVTAKHEIGCFDKIELAPSIQQEPDHNEYYNNSIETLFYHYLNNRQGIIADVILSEEGGRFYHEQNRNVIIEIDETEIDILPEGYFWVDYGTLNYLVQLNNCLNIQLRNLLSLLKV